MVKKDIPGASGSPLSIGPIIEAELRRQERTVAWFSRKIHCDRRNIYDIFHRDSIDTSLLFKISSALGVDFFRLYSSELEHTENQQITPPDYNNQLIVCDLDHFDQRPARILLHTSGK